MANPKPTDCRVCNYTFSEGLRSPRNLPCGHHLCSGCIGKLIADESKTCPFCRTQFDAKYPDDLPVNLGMLECAKYISLQTYPASSSNSKSSAAYQQRIENFKEGTLKANQGVLDVLVALKKDAQYLLDNTKEMKDSLCLDKTDLKDNILPRIYDILSEINTNSEKLDSVSQMLEEYLKKIQEREISLVQARKTLDSAKTLEGAAVIVDETEQINISISNWTEDLKERVMCQDGLLQETRKNTRTISRIKKDLMRDIIPRPGNDAVNLSPARSLGKQLDVPTEVTPLQLWEMHDGVRRLVEQGRLFALDINSGPRKSARIVIENKKLLMYNLVEESEPIADACYMQYESALSLSMAPRSLFLDFRLKESLLGRVWIQGNETEECYNLQKPFTMGKIKGYIDKPVQVSKKGELCERIICGRSLTEATKGNWSNLKMRYRTGITRKCGMVLLLDDVSPPLICFNRGPYAEGFKVLGSVTDGLSMLSDVVHQCDDLREVLISNSGVELSTEFPIYA